MSKAIKKSVGDTKPIRYTLYRDKSKEPEILTGHSFVLTLTLNDVDTDVNGTLHLGDCGVYFDIPPAITDTAGTYSFKLKSTNTDSDTETVDEGHINYA